MAGGAVTIEELISGLQGSLGSTPEAFRTAAEHLLRIGGGLLSSFLCLCKVPESHPFTSILKRVLWLSSLTQCAITIRTSALLRCLPVCVNITVSIPQGLIERHFLAGTHVRAAASIGGNLALLRERALQSNLAPVLIALGATVTVTSLHSQR